MSEEELAWEAMRDAVLAARRDPSDENLAIVRDCEKRLVEAMERASSSPVASAA